MILIYKQIIILTTYLLVFSGCFVVQTANVDSNKDAVNAVFAGTQIDSQGNSQTIAFHFRLNGTYTNQLDQPDWQTRVDGNYKITGQKLNLFPQNAGEKVQEMEFQSQFQNLVYQDIALYKLNVTNKIGTLFIGFYRNIETTVIKKDKEVTPHLETSYVFDEKGNFGKDEYRKYEKAEGGFGTVAIKEKAFNGTYTIKESLLTLHYNGETATKSFFSRNTFGNAFVALVDGKFFYGFEDRPEELEKIDSNTSPTFQPESQIDGMQILRQANLAHGGAKLDNLKTVLITKKITYLGTIFESKILMDLLKKHIRIEDNLNDDFSIRQLAGNNSWLWRKNQKNPLEENHRIELLKYFSRGGLGLRTDVLKNIVINSAQITDSATNQKVVNITKDDEKVSLIFDAGNRLISESFVEYKREIINLNDDYKSVDGVIFPFIGTKQMNSTVIQENFTAIEANPEFTESDWAIPN